MSKRIGRAALRWLGLVTALVLAVGTCAFGASAYAASREALRQATVTAPRSLPPATPRPSR